MTAQRGTAAATVSGWRFGSRVERVRASRSFGLVLVLIVASFVFAAVAPDGAWASGLLLLVETCTFAVALWTTGVARQDSKLSLALIVLAAAAALALVIVGGDALTGAVGLLSGLLTVATIAAIVLGVADQSEVNAQSVTGAICVYLLFGMLFMFLYGVVATLGSGPFFAQGTDGTRSIRLYFSYVTLATLGYGDYTPAGGIGRTLAITEAIFGQLYLVTVVAVLVSRMHVRRRG
ncbi:MAG TPA: potassium channel family protein [Gaiellaceae bacterium]